MAQGFAKYPQRPLVAARCGSRTPEPLDAATQTDKRLPEPAKSTLRNPSQPLRQIWPVASNRADG